MPNVYLTDSFISNATCPSDKDQIIYWDHPKGIDGKLRNGSVSGLGLRITHNGAKSFVHAYHFNGERKRAVIGKAITMNIGNARLSTQLRTTQIEEGNNPDVDKINYRKKHALTFREITDMYFEQHVSKTSDKNNWEFCRLIAPWLAKPKTTQRNYKPSGLVAFGTQHANKVATKITPSDISKFFESFSSDHVANSALRHLRALFNWTIRMQIIDMRNPCSPHRCKAPLLCTIS